MPAGCALLRERRSVFVRAAEYPRGQLSRLVCGGFRRRYGRGGRSVLVLAESAESGVWRVHGDVAAAEQPRLVLEPA